MCIRDSSCTLWTVSCSVWCGYITRTPGNVGYLSNYGNDTVANGEEGSDFVFSCVHNWMLTVQGRIYGEGPDSLPPEGKKSWVLLISSFLGCFIFFSALYANIIVILLFFNIKTGLLHRFYVYFEIRNIGNSIQSISFSTVSVKRMFTVLLPFTDFTKLPWIFQSL